jgi:hypothetical protein
MQVTMPTIIEYSTLLCTICTVAFLIWLCQELKMLAQNIRNEVGVITIH